MENVTTSPILDSAVKPYVRPRRLRATPALRELVRENRWSARQLV